MDKLTNRRSPAAMVGLLLGLGCASLLLRSCLNESETTERMAEATSIDLLARNPDRTFEQIGQLLPGAKDEWGQYDLGGWFPATVPGTEGRPDAAMLGQPSARLLLLATEPVDRELVLKAWIPAEEANSPGSVAVYLNDIQIEEALALGTVPETYAMETPGELWRLGENVLELRSQPYASAEGGTTFNHVLLAEVNFGPSSAIEIIEGGIELSSGTGLRYDLEPSGSPRLQLRGSASGEGVLELNFRMVDPMTGIPDISSAPLLNIPLTAGSQDLDLPVIYRKDRILRLEIMWRAEESQATLQLAALSLEDCESAPRPPIFFISIDTFAAQHMASYGYSRQTTPNLDALQSEAVLFERCLANAPWTTPSYLSVLSGLFPRAHHVESEGLGENTLLDQWCLAENRWTMGESMRARGYETAGFVDTAWLDERFRVNQGFDLWDDSAADLQFENPAYGVVYVTEKATGWLRGLEPGRTPFMLLHALDAHGPYLPELPHLGTFQSDLPEVPRRALAGADYQAAGSMPAWMAVTMHHQPQMRSLKEMQAEAIPREIDVDPIIARYDEALLKIDSYLGHFFDAIRVQGIWDDALIIVTGDHGEAFRDEYFGHARLYQEVLEVPLLVKFPGGAGAGKRIATGVQLVDIYPTMVELTGNEPAPEWLNGQSLLPLLEDKQTETRLLFSEGGHHEAYTIVHGDWKLVESYPTREAGTAVLLTHPLLPADVLRANFPELVDQPLTSELMHSIEAQPDYAERREAVVEALRSGEPYIRLFDLDADPRETTDLSGSNPAKIEELMPLLQGLKRKARAEQGRAIQGIPMEPMNDEDRKTLEDLGYI
ncbi:MAG: arylsulfatase A-like enzyme [Planctomycetota bacterium]|jgi:arylsulfatase A-like enzyme